MSFVARSNKQYRRRKNAIPQVIAKLYPPEQTVSVYFFLFILIQVKILVYLLYIILYQSGVYPATHVFF